MRAALLMVAACGSTPAPTAASAASPKPAATPASTACPTGAELTRIAAELHGGKVEEPWCVALRVPGGTRWFLAGGPVYFEMLIAPPANVLWQLKREAGNLEVHDQRAIDLDGDGVDELLYVTRGAANATMMTRLEVYGFSDPTHPGGTSTILEIESGMPCKSSHKVIDEGRKKVIEVTGDCMPDGTHTYVWNGKSLDAR